MMLSQKNAFTIGYGQPVAIKDNAHINILKKMTAQEKRDFILRDVKNGISIPTQDESDRSKAVRGRRVGV